MKLIAANLIGPKIEILDLKFLVYKSLKLFHSSRSLGGCCNLGRGSLLCAGLLGSWLLGSLLCFLWCSFLWCSFLGVDLLGGVSDFLCYKIGLLSTIFFWKKTLLRKRIANLILISKRDVLDVVSWSCIEIFLVVTYPF